ncbi:MAG TPA: hypothetical protein DG753_09385 [Clostridium sp.]|nr:hypothetical protein [Clostridium sp.]
MDNLIQNSVFFGGIISLITYGIGVLIKRKFKLAIFNPLLISIAITIAFLLAFNINYDKYYDGAKYISYLLTPATVCLAIPLYEKIELLKKNWKAIGIGVICGVLANFVCVFILARALKLGHQEYVTLIPKSITTAIGMSVSEEIGGIVTISVAVIIVTGIFGSMVAEGVCNLCRIKNPVAKGIAIGSCSHAIGTSKAMEMGQIEGAMSSLAIVMTGLLTVICAPLFALCI